jgi:hypothetical protein
VNKINLNNTHQQESCFVLNFLERKIQRQGIRSFEDQDFTYVNDCFQNENNEVFGVLASLSFVSLRFLQKIVY